MVRGASKGEYMGSSLVDVHVILCDNAPGRLACTLFEGMYVGGLPCQPMRSTGTELHCTTKKPAKHVGGHVFTVRVVITVNGSPYTASCGAPLYAPPPLYSDRTIARMTAFPCTLHHCLQVRLDGHICAVHAVAGMLKRPV